MENAEVLKLVHEIRDQNNEILADLRAYREMNPRLAKGDFSKTRIALVEAS